MRAVYSYNLIPSKKIKFADVMLFCLSLIITKKAGYETVLYCDKNFYDEVLLKYNIDKLIDEINPTIPPIKEEGWWAIAKFEAMKMEKQNSVFIDGDAFLCKELPIDKDLIVWEKEMIDIKPVGIYRDDLIYQLNTLFQYENRRVAYNTGILYFKDNKIKDEFIDRTKIYLNTYGKNAHMTIMVVAEQVNLYEFSKEKKLDTAIIGDMNGFSEYGCHFYCVKLFHYGNTKRWNFGKVYTQLIKDLFPEKYELIRNDLIEKEMTLSENEIRNFDYYKVLKRAIEAPR